MFQKLSVRLTLAALLLAPLGLAAAQGPTHPPSTQAQAQVPRTIRISGELNELGASKVPSLETIRFTLYQDQKGTTPLWSETQQIEVAPQGRYTVLLGAATEGGIPLPLFSSMDAHWLGVQLEGQHEQSPVLLVSVPYALKAADAETLGGLPASSFLRSDEASTPAMTPAVKAGREPSGSAKALAAIYGRGDTNYISKFTSPTTIGNSILYDNGFVGLRTISPRTDLDVNGTIATRRLTLVQDSTTSSRTWNLDNDTGRFRLFWEPYLTTTGYEVLTATTSGVNVTGDLDVSGKLSARNHLSTNRIVFPNPASASNPLAPYYEADSSGDSLTFYLNFSLPAGSPLFPYPVITTKGGTVGFFTAEPRNNFDLVGEMIATSRILLAENSTPTSEAWQIVNAGKLFRLAHQDSLTPHGQVGTAVMVATESNRIGINTESPTHSLDVAGNIGILGTGHGLVFPDGTVQTSAASTLFGYCISNAASQQTCTCAHVLSQVLVSSGQSCSTAGLPGNCTATSQAGPPVTYGTCCVCN